MWLLYKGPEEKEEKLKERKGKKRNKTRNLYISSAFSLAVLQKSDKQRAFLHQGVRRILKMTKKEIF